MNEIVTGQSRCELELIAENWHQQMTAIKDGPSGLEAGEFENYPVCTRKQYFSVFSRFPGCSEFRYWSAGEGTVLPD